MTEAFKHLVVVDLPGIKDYVFGTDKLVEIRGASALLDNLNRNIIPERIEKRFGKARSTCVFACGGAAQFIIEDTSENIQDEFLAMQGEVYHQSGGALQIITGMARLIDNYGVSLGYPEPSDPHQPDISEPQGFVPFRRFRQVA
jgi:hypothetical protein